MFSRGQDMLPTAHVAGMLPQGSGVIGLLSQPHPWEGAASIAMAVPGKVRKQFSDLGLSQLSSGWHEVAARGVGCVYLGPPLGDRVSDLNMDDELMALSCWRSKLQQLLNLTSAF